MLFSNGDKVIELFSSQEVCIEFYNQVLLYLQIKKYQVVDDIVSDDHWHLLSGSDEHVLMILKADGEPLNIFNFQELKKEIRREKIASII